MIDDRRVIINISGLSSLAPSFFHWSRSPNCFPPLLPFTSGSRVQSTSFGILVTTMLSARLSRSFTRDLFLPLRTAAAKQSTKPRNFLASTFRDYPELDRIPLLSSVKPNERSRQDPLTQSTRPVGFAADNRDAITLPAVPIDVIDGDAFSGSAALLITKSCRSAIRRNSGT